ncbi:hypothetical protein MC885_012802, partial [Smutsia gigantea]
MSTGVSGEQSLPRLGKGRGAQDVRSFSPPASGGLQEAAGARNPKSRPEFPSGELRRALPEGAFAARITGPGGGGSGGPVMDLEEAKEFKERCTQCASVSWGLTDEGKYYCTSCHNVTERSKEVVNTEAIPNTQIKAINRGIKRKRKLEKGWDWYVCEGFQHILYQQAEALKTLGVNPELKDEVLHNFWKRYLQKSKQAYCKNPVYTSKRKATVSEDNPSQSDWDSEPELLSDFSCPSFVESGAESQPDVRTQKSFLIT